MDLPTQIARLKYSANSLGYFFHPHNQESKTFFFRSSLREWIYLMFRDGDFAKDGIDPRVILGYRRYLFYSYLNGEKI